MKWICAGVSRHALMAGAVMGLSMGLGATSAAATVMNYTITLSELNDSGVSGGGTLSFDDTTNLLNVNYTVNGLTQGVHPQHIHGLFEEGIGVPGGTPANSTVPTIANDTDGDGLIEVLEGATTYGDILLSLTETPGAGDFPMLGGTLNYSQVFDLSDMNVFQPPSIATGNVYSMADLFPLDLREIVIHGDVVDGQGFLATLPVAAGEIEVARIAQVTEPGTLGILACGLVALGFSGRRRRSMAARAPA
jgi:hypothetical protein